MFNGLHRTALSVLCFFVAGAASGAPPTPYRVYRNPSNSVHIRPQPCGANICGIVIWANEKAKADAARGGTSRLNGQQFFKDFTPDGPDRWKGSVFVPDINKTFSGHVARVNARTLKGTGCLVGRMGCKSQVWTLVD